MDSDDECYDKSEESTNLLLTKTTHEIARLNPYRYTFFVFNFFLFNFCSSDDPLKHTSEPELVEHNAGLVEDEDDASKLDPNTYCICEKCTRMPSILESFCCLSKNPGECLTTTVEFKKLTDPLILENNLR